MKELNFKLIDAEGKTHIVHICDQSFAEAYFSDCRSIDAPTVLISITCPDDPDARILGAENLHVLRLRMYDLDTSIKGKEPVTLNDLKDLKGFVDENNDVTDLFVHCGAGTSRSPAVAWAVCEYLHWGEPREIGTIVNDSFVPNRHVYRTCLQALSAANWPEF